MVKQVRPAVVRIQTGSVSGSGVIFETQGRNGYVITNHHVVEGESRVDVIVNDSTTYRGTVLGTDPVRDLAVVRICCGSFQSLPFGNAATLQPGDEVVAIGYPLGLPGEATVTRGIVSAVRYDSRYLSDVIQTDAAINPGNSGGPMLSPSGQILGINTFRYEETESGRPVEGVGFAISEETVQQQIPTLQAGSPSPTPTPTPSAGSFVSVSAGDAHTCGVKTDGSVVCWGLDSDGQATPPTGSFISVSASVNHTCGVRHNGSVVCWGDDAFGQATPPAGSFASVSTGYFHTCGVKSNGSVVCWGGDSSGQATPPAGSFTSVSAGWVHNCGVKSSGSVVCWGGDTTGETTPPAGSFASVSTHASHYCGVKSSGSVVCWGFDASGQATPPAGSFTSVNAGGRHTCGVKSNGSVVCWGDDNFGQATPPQAGSPAPTPTPTPGQTSDFGPTSGDLRHNPSDGFIKTEYADVSIADMMVEATFVNPYSAESNDWDYGFIFRRERNGPAIHIVLTSDRRWGLNWRETASADSSQRLGGGTLNTFNTGSGDRNHLRVVAIKERGWLFVNGEFVSNLNLSDVTGEGDVAVITGAFIGNEVDGAVTGFENFGGAELVRRYGPADGTLKYEQGVISGHDSGVRTRDLVAEAEFVNPRGSDWDYGLVIRNPAYNRLEAIGLSYGPWWFHYTRDVGDDYTKLADGHQVNLMSRNHLLVIAFEGSGWFFVNESLVAKLDLGHNLDSGDVSVIGSLFEGDTGEPSFENFNVWAP